MFKLFLVKRVKPIFLIAILSMLLRYHAKPYPESPNSITWTMFLTPSPHDYYDFYDYYGDYYEPFTWEIDPTEEGIEDASKKGSNQDVSTCLLHNISNRFVVYI